MSLPKAIKKKLDTRDWRDLQQHWIAKAVIDEGIGDKPDSSICEAVELMSLRYSAPIPIGMDDLIDVEGVHTLFLRESIFLAHKSCAIARSISRDLNARHGTYADVSGYNASFFIARALLLILGFHPLSTRICKSTVLTDIFHNGVDGKNTKLFFIPNANSFGHADIWELLKIAFNITHNLPIDPEFMSFLADLNPTDFASSRNQVQYHNCAWTYDDLHNDETIELDWIQPFQKNIYYRYSAASQEEHFPIILYFIMMRKYIFLLRDIARGTQILQSETSKIITNLSINNPLDVDSWLSAHGE